jgi:hypothetical protein
MTCMSFFTTAPLWLLALALVGLTTLIAMVGPIIIRKHVSLDQLRTNNEIAGFKFSRSGGGGNHLSAVKRDSRRAGHRSSRCISLIR